jgi:CO dehydrogenase/acetyl-CoA synthase gamma subunit (corrinoid Fe-S protein)
MGVYLDNDNDLGAVVHPVNYNPVVFDMNFSMTSFVMTQDLSTAIVDS